MGGQTRASAGEEKSPLPAQGLTRRTLGGLFWTSSGTAAQVAVQVLVLVVLARLLLPEEFGLVGAALVVIGFSEIFSQLGVGPAIVQRLELDEQHLRAGFALSLGLGVLLTGLIWLLAPAIALFFRMEELTPVLRALAFVFCLQSVSVVAESLVQRELRFRELAGIGLASYIVGYGLVGVTAAAVGFGVWALVGARLAQTCVGSACLLVLQPHAKGPRFEPRAVRELLAFGGGVTVSRVFNYLAVQGDNLVVGRCLGADALGLYGRAYQLMVVPANGFGQVVDRVLFPTLAKIQDSPHRLATGYGRGVGLTALLVLPGSAATCVLAPEIIEVLLGPKWSGATAPLQILAVGMFFRTGYKMAATLARATGAVYEVAWRQAVYAVLVIGGAYLGHPWGLPGIASAVVIAVAVEFFLLAQLGLRLTHMTWGAFARAHVPGLLLAAVVLGVALGAASLSCNPGLPALSVLLLAAFVPVLVVGLCLALLALHDAMSGKPRHWLLPEWLIGSRRPVA